MTFAREQINMILILSKCFLILEKHLERGNLAFISYYYKIGLYA